MAKTITLVIPVFNEQKNLERFYTACQQVTQDLDQYNWKYMFVDDGSQDASWGKIQQLASKEKNISGIRLSRNFGKEIALTAGAEAALETTDAVIFIDADLQHPPPVIRKLIKKWEEGFAIVATKRKSIHYSLIRKLGSKLFYYLLNRFSNIQIEPYSTDFRLLDRQVLEVLQTFQERTRFFRGIIDWMGFSKTHIIFAAPDRQEGNSTFSFRRLVNLAINSFTSFSLFPLRLAGYLGISIILGMVILLIFMFISQLFGGAVYTVLAYFVVFNTLLFGLVLSAIGLLALYIGHIHTEVVKRPLYIIQEKTSSE